MRKPLLATSLALPLLALPGAVPPAAAGPPEGVSGRMVFVDEVADGLREYAKETAPERRLACLRKLAATQDPRVAIVLVEVSNDGTAGELDCEAAEELWWHFASPDAASRRGKVNDGGLKMPKRAGYRDWWKKNEADVRRHAARLSR
jgi:hypothetical protein